MFELTGFLDLCGKALQREVMIVHKASVDALHFAFRFHVYRQQRRCGVFLHDESARTGYDSSVELPADRWLKIVAASHQRRGDATLKQYIRVRGDHTHRMLDEVNGMWLNGVLPIIQRHVFLWAMKAALIEITILAIANSFP